ncbi:MAG TPA: TonB family protein [Methyloceanibacter sp.]|nr:TonB family protein [Methyloceanibacter sp.]
MSEHRILQSLLTVAAASVLVCGSLLLLTSTAPWTRLPPESETATQAAPRFADALPDEVRRAPAVSDQGDTTAALATDADGTHTASTPLAVGVRLLPEPVELAPSTDADILSPAGQELTALGTPLNPETAQQVEDVGPAVRSAKTEASDLASAIVAPFEIAASAPAVPDLPETVANADAATDRTADMLTALITRVIAGETTEAATEEVAGMLATLPPAPPVPVASEKTGPAAAEVAGVLADLRPPPPMVVAAEKTQPATEMAAEILAASPDRPLPADAENGKAEAGRIAGPAGPLPPMLLRKPETPPEPKVAVAAPAVEATPQPKLAIAAAPPREKPAPREAPRQTATQSGGPLGIWKPMALAPADEPSVSLSKPATARPSGKAYASQVWAKLARHKPRAGQRGGASVSFAIGANGTLGAVRIARSSGNARIDQLALQTVRSAAPFPRPPAGSASYTIRIDFQ